MDDAASSREVASASWSLARSRLTSGRGEHRRDGCGATAARRARRAAAAGSPAALVRAAAARGQVLALTLGDPDVGGGRPALELRQAPLAGQVVLLAARFLPLLDCLREPAMEKQVLAPLVHPRAQALPLAEECLVGDLHGRAAGSGSRSKVSSPCSP